MFDQTFDDVIAQFNAQEHPDRAGAARGLAARTLCELGKDPAFAGIRVRTAALLGGVPATDERTTVALADRIRWRMRTGQDMTRAWLTAQAGDVCHAATARHLAPQLDDSGRALLGLHSTLDGLAATQTRIKRWLAAGAPVTLG